MYTSHGHQIPNTPVESEKPPLVARCGGPGLCQTCSGEILYGLREQKAVKHETYLVDESRFTPSEKARLIVAQYINARLGEDNMIEPLRLSDVHIVWFAKILQNWKCILTTNIPNGMFFEVTYSGERQETYIDAYVKWENVAIPDGGKR